MARYVAVILQNPPNKSRNQSRSPPPQLNPSGEYRFALSPSLSLSFPFLALFRSAAPHLSPPPLPCLESVYITCTLSTRASPLRLRCLVVSNMCIDLAPSRRVSAISVLPSLELPLSTASMASWTTLAPQSLVPRRGASTKVGIQVAMDQKYHVHLLLIHFSPS